MSDCSPGQQNRRLVTMPDHIQEENGSISGKVCAVSWTWVPNTYRQSGTHVRHPHICLASLTAPRPWLNLHIDYWGPFYQAYEVMHVAHRRGARVSLARNSRTQVTSRGSMPDCRQSLLSAGLVLTDDDGIDRLLAVPQALTPDIHIDRHVLSTHGKQCGKHASATPTRVTTPYRGVSSHNEAGDLCLSPSTSTGSRCARRASSPPFMPSPVLPTPRSSLLSATAAPYLNVSNYRRARSVCTCI